MTSNDRNDVKNRQTSVVASGGGAVPYSPLREMLGYDPFQRLLPNFDPQLDVIRTENGFDVEIPVAGFNSSQIEVVFKDDILTIAGKNERRSFTRSLHLPEDIDSTNIEAIVDNGMLTLKLRRCPEAEPRTITVKSA